MTDFIHSMAGNNAPLVLIVDDDDLVRRVERVILVRGGYRVEEASSGAQAVAHFNNGLDPDLVLCDLVMPGISGEALAARTRASRPQQKFLFVTGYAQRLRRLPERITADELVFLDKPFKSASLIAAVARMLARESTTYEIEPGVLVSVAM